MTQVATGVELVGPMTAAGERVLTPEALEFVASLERRFRASRQQILEARVDRQRAIDIGVMPRFLYDTVDVRNDKTWRVAPAPADLDDRRVEITGPAEPKMMINALNSGAKVFMADLEDALSPTWENSVGGQLALMEAVRGTLSFDSPEGKQYRLNEKVATLLVRPRGWHMVERHLVVDGEPVSASLFDAGLYLFHNAAERVARGTAPYFYLPKLESYLEARLWNDVFVFAQEALGIPRGTIRATVLIETILAAFEMEEILYELREHAAGLNAGRWDYIFSIIKKFRIRPAMILPDRGQVTMGVPFMRAYAQLMVKTCHARGAHAIGGMAAFIPNRRDPEVTENALAKVREDKLRESGDGFDGTWVAHPDLVPVAMEIFDAKLGGKPNQKDVLRPDVNVTPDDLLKLRIPGGEITDAGLRLNVNVAIQYMDNWLRGNGAAAINNLMEDAATAEISRSQLWQWIRHSAVLADGRTVTADLYRQVRDEELAKLGGREVGRQGEAADLLDQLILDEKFAQFLTNVAYPLLP